MKKHEESRRGFLIGTAVGASAVAGAGLVPNALAQTHGGWENNEGAYGEFTFDVAQRTITLDYNERVETSEYSQHMF